MSADTSSDLNHPILNLSPQEKTAFSFLFSQADSDQLGVVTGERAVSFFERTKVSPNVLGEIWQIADTENRGLLTKPGFCMVLRLIGHYQAGKEPSVELAFKPGPVPKFEGLQIPGVGPSAASPAIPSPTGGQLPPNALQPQLSGQGPIRVPPLDPLKVQQYSGLFQNSGAQNGMLDGVTAKNIFERAGLPNEVLGKIWNLSDRQQRGALDQTEFIVAMHLLTSMKSRTMTALPNNLPPGLYEAAARRGAPPPPGARSSFGAQGAVPRQFTGGSAGTPARAQSPLARPPAFGTPPPQSAQTTGTPWLVTAQEKAKYDQFFAGIDTASRGVLTGEQAVSFFSDSGLPEDTLAAIWDLADIKSEGQLNRDEFAVAMYLIGRQRAPNPAPLPAFLPPALVPPSMRQQQQQPQSTAPAFDNANNRSNLPKSAADDLFGLDEPSAPALQQPALQAQTTGASASQDPFGSAPASPSSPQRFQAQPQSASTMFKPFMPTSAFGTSIAHQHTGGSMGSTQRGFQPQQPAHPSQLHTAMTADDDLLGDNDAHAEEASKITSDTTELANMSSQIGNLRNQMETTQAKKSTTQADFNATQTQKRDLELRLQQFRSQYEAEVRAVKELETQLAASRESTKKLGQELAMLEGTYQDLQTQHNQVSQQLQADQQENATLKQRISQSNAEVAQLRPQIEKMKLDARQQKGLVSINKKQLTTNEGERDRLQGEKATLEREASEREEAARRETAEQEEAARNAPKQQSNSGRDAAFGAAGLGAVGAAAFGAYEAIKDRLPGGGEPRSPPASGTLSPTNPFFRKPSSDGTADRAVSPPTAFGNSGPTPSAFDALFGPSAAFSPGGHAVSRTSTPPTTSFNGRNISQPGSSRDEPPTNMTGSVQSVSSAGEPTPSATPPLSDKAKESPIVPPSEQQPPPPPENRQFTPSQLPIAPLLDRSREDPEVSSTMARPPASRAGGVETPREREVSESVPDSFGPPSTLPTEEEGVPGGFPRETDEPSANTQEVPEPVHPTPAVTKANDDFDSAFAGFGGDDKPSGAHAQSNSDFDSVFAGFGGDKTGEASKQESDPFAPSSSQQRSGGHSSEFPPIQSLEPESDESSDEEEEEGERMHPGFNNSSGTVSPPPPGHGLAEPISGPVLSAAKHALPEAGLRPTVQSVDSTASAVPSVNAMSSPPSYEQSNEPSHGGSGERTGSNQFPPEFGGLLPSREDPTSPPPPTSPPRESAIAEEKEIQIADMRAPPERSGTGSSSLYPTTVPQTPSTSEFFHDASSRPISSVTDAYATPPQNQATNQQPTNQQPTNQQPTKGDFDDFDAFDDLAEAKEADKSGSSDFDFGFGGGRQSADEFNPAFDSPAVSTTNTMASAQQTPVPSARQLDGFSNFQPSHSTNNSSSPFDASVPESSIQNTPQNVQHDWDAIFSGLDSSKNVDTSFGGNDEPWGPAPAASSSEAGPSTNGAASSAAVERTPTASSPVVSSKQAQAAQQMGRAITPGTEHDDPILKRLTGMGYPRNDALKALEMYDYDINMAVDHLTTK